MVGRAIQLGVAPRNANVGRLAAGRDHPRHAHLARRAAAALRVAPCLKAIQMVGGQSGCGPVQGPDQGGQTGRSRRIRDAIAIDIADVHHHADPLVGEHIGAQAGLIRNRTSRPAARAQARLTRTTERQARPGRKTNTRAVRHRRGGSGRGRGCRWGHGGRTRISAKVLGTELVSRETGEGATGAVVATHIGPPRGLARVGAIVEDAPLDPTPGPPQCHGDRQQEDPAGNSSRYHGAAMIPRTKGASSAFGASCK